MKNIINFTGILTSLFLSLPGFAQYAPNFDVTFQTANNSNYNQVLASTGVSVPMWQMLIQQFSVTLEFQAIMMICTGVT